jgi:hypothetical protein
LRVVVSEFSISKMNPKHDSRFTFLEEQNFNGACAVLWTNAAAICSLWVICHSDSGEAARFGEDLAAALPISAGE